jgi:hypothetical protein
LDVVTQNLAVTFGTTFAKTLATLSTYDPSRHVSCNVQLKEVIEVER